MDSLCDLDLSTSYMLSVSRVAESCTGKKIEENSFKLPRHVIRKRKKLWEAIESKYSIIEDDTCEVALEINTTEHTEYTAKESVSRHKTTWSNFTEPPRQSLRKRKLQNLDAVPADMCWENEKQLHSNESGVPQCVQQAAVSHDEGNDVEDFCVNLQDDCMAEILSGSLKLLRNNSLKRLENVSNGGDKLSNSHSSLKKHTGGNTVDVFENKLNFFAEKIPTNGGDEKGVTFEVLAANKEVRKCLSPCEGNVKVNVKNPKSLTLYSHGANFTCVRNASPTLEAIRKCGVCNASQLDPYETQKCTSCEVNEVNAMIQMAFENMPLSVLKMFGSNLKLWIPRVILQRCESVPTVNVNTAKNVSELDKDKIVGFCNSEPNSSALSARKDICLFSKEVPVNTDFKCANTGNGQESLNKSVHTFKCHRIAEDHAESCLEKCGETFYEVQHCRGLEITERSGNKSAATCNGFGGNTRDFYKCKEPCQVGNVENGVIFESGDAMLQKESSGCSPDLSKGVEDECLDNKNTRNNFVKPLFMPMSTEICGKDVDTAKTKKFPVLQTSKVLFTEYKPLIQCKTDSVSDVTVKSISSDSDRTILPGDVKDENTLDKQNVSAESDVSDATSSAPYKAKDVNTDEINKENIKPSSSPLGSSKLTNCGRYVRSSNLKKERVISAEIWGEVSNKVFGNTKVIEANNYTFTKQVSKGVHSHKNPLQKTKLGCRLREKEGNLRCNFGQNSFHEYIQRTCEKVVNYDVSHHKEMQREVQCSAVSPIHKTKLKTFKSKQHKYLIPSNSHLKFELENYEEPSKNTKKEKKRFCMKVVSSEKRACTYDFSV